MLLGTKRDPLIHFVDIRTFSLLLELHKTNEKAEIDVYSSSSTFRAKDFHIAYRDSH